MYFWTYLYVYIICRYGYRKLYTPVTWAAQVKSNSSFGDVKPVSPEVRDGLRRKAMGIFSLSKNTGRRHGLFGSPSVFLKFLKCPEMELPSCEEREALSDVFREVDWLKSSCAWNLCNSRPRWRPIDWRDALWIWRDSFREGIDATWRGSRTPKFLRNGSMEDSDAGTPLKGWFHQWIAWMQRAIQDDMGSH